MCVRDFLQSFQTITIFLEKTRKASQIGREKFEFKRKKIIAGDKNKFLLADKSAKKYIYKFDDRNVFVPSIRTPFLSQK